MKDCVHKKRDMNHFRREMIHIPFCGHSPQKEGFYVMSAWTGTTTQLLYE